MQFWFAIVAMILCNIVKSLQSNAFLHSKTRFGNSLRALSSRLSTASVSSSDKMPQQPKRILSGIQPTGALHLGNYLGAIRQWEQLQRDFDSYFCVVDLHAITLPHDPRQLRQDTLNAAAMYMACGIDPEKSTIFIQSHVPAHSELTWILNCITPISWLERMTQFKEKSTRQSEAVCTGLFDYPVLMAADILLYRPDVVPVGNDQHQHLELARDIVRRFHDRFCKSGAREVFVEPSPFTVKEGARVMSLTDGTSKMSKSAESDNSRINLLDSPDVIMKKIKRCKTDSTPGLEWGNPERPEATNLLNILQAVSGKSKEDILAETQAMNWGKFKPHLADAIITMLTPIQARYVEIRKDETYLESVLQKGKESANAVASTTLLEVKETMGFLLPKANRQQ